MTNTTARCDRIVALIDACLADLDVIGRPARIAEPSPMPRPFASPNPRKEPR